jgi:hypothetical protein
VEVDRAVRRGAGRERVSAQIGPTRPLDLPALRKHLAQPLNSLVYEISSLQGLVCAHDNQPLAGKIAYLWKIALTANMEI